MEVDLATLEESLHIRPDEGTLEQRWIVARLAETAGVANLALEAYRFDDAANSIYRFFWNDLCDWYLEIVKLRLDFSGEAGSGKRGGGNALATLVAVFDASLRLLAPFMPFLTEEIWHALHRGTPPKRSIALAKFPSGAFATTDPVAVAHMTELQNLIVEIRAMRKDLGVPEKEAVPIRIYSDARGNSLVENNLDIIQRLARVAEIQRNSTRMDDAEMRSTSKFDIALIYEKPRDIPAERERLSKDLIKFEKELQSKQSQLQNEAFLAKAPANVVEGLRTRAQELTVLIEKGRVALAALETVGSR